MYDYYTEWNIGTIDKTGKTTMIRATLHGNDQGWGNPTGFKIWIQDSAGTVKWAWQANFPRGPGTASYAVSNPFDVVRGDVVKIAGLTWGWGHAFALRGGSVEITV
jgi:hypothetical protein